jgi:hypothetical protein
MLNWVYDVKGQEIGAGIVFDPSATIATKS